MSEFSSTSLTRHLITLTETGVKAATEHPFLTEAAKASLSSNNLKAWLGQNRLYALSYVHFLSAILHRISVPSDTTIMHSLQGQYVKLLIECLVNVKSEINLFEETAQAEGLLDEICAMQPSVQTRAYQDLFAGATAPHRPLLTGIVTLWAIEWCDYKSWSLAAAQIPQDVALENNQRNVMQKVFIPNWSSFDFKELVDDLGSSLDNFAGRLERGSLERLEAENAWRQVLWAEKNFWPAI